MSLARSPPDPRRNPRACRRHYRSLAGPGPRPRARPRRARLVAGARRPARRSSSRRHRRPAGRAAPRRPGRRDRPGAPGGPRRAPPTTSAAPTCWSTTRARSAAARCRPSPTWSRRRTPGSSRSTWWRRWRWPPRSSPSSGRRRGRVLNISSDAAVEAYETWGGYGSAKAALDHASRVLAAEEPGLRVYAVDPGDMRTAMHQDAFPGEDIGDRPEPETVVPALLDLLGGDLPSGRYRAERPGKGAAMSSQPVEAYDATAVRSARTPPEAARPGPRRGAPGRRDPGRHPAHPARRAGRAALPRRPAGGQHQRHPAGRGRRRAARLHLGACTCRPSSTTAPGWSSCGCPTTPARASRSPARCCGCPAASGCGCWRRTRPASSGSGGPCRCRRSTGSTTSGSRAARSATPTSTAPGR